jgi:spore coat polysaccharide biosynthesis protein SpsF (cytidylyltransferase family)
MSNIGLVITARLKSSRLKEKTIQKINGKPTIEILLDRIINKKYPVIMALPKDKENDILENIAISKGIEVYRGDDDSPLHRLTNVALYYGYDHVVRITQDDILIDLTILFNQIKMHKRGQHDYTYCKRIPEGCAAEVIKTTVLEEIVNEVGDKPVEFISYYLKNKYRTFEYYPDMEYQFPYRLTMDYEEDLTLLRLLFACLPEPIGTLDIINFLKRHKYFLQINHLPQVTLYTCNYNTGKYIIDTINSVLSQTMCDYEYIIIDDYSTDDSMNIITEYFSQLDRPFQNKIKILRNSENKGLPACSNMALNIARGKYIMRIDSDDVIKPTMLEEMISQVRFDGTQACLSGYYNTDENLNKIDEVNENMWHPACALISTWTANELKYQEKLKYLEGKDFWERFQEYYKHSFIKEPLWKYRKRPGQKTQEKEHPNNLLINKEN